MRLEQLYYFVEAAHCGSMQAAAQKLYTSQQNVSKAIKQLEDEFGQILFTRSNQGIYLTAEGRRIYEIALEITTKATLLSQQYSAVQPAATSGTLQIFAHISTSSFLVPFIEQLHQLYPQIKIAVSMQNLVEPFIEETSNTASIWLLSLLKDDLEEQLQGKASSHDIYCFREEPLKIYMNTASPFINQQSISLKTLSDQPLIDHAGNLRVSSFSAKLFSRYGCKPNIIFSCSNSQLALEYISRHNAYCLGTNAIISPHSSVNYPTICIKPLKENLMMCSILIIPKSLHAHPIINAFWQIFDQQMQDGYTQLVL